MADAHDEVLTPSISQNFREALQSTRTAYCDMGIAVTTSSTSSIKESFEKAKASKHPIFITPIKTIASLAETISAIDSFMSYIDQPLKKMECQGLASAIERLTQQSSDSLTGNAGSEHHLIRPGQPTDHIDLSLKNTLRTYGEELHQLCQELEPHLKFTGKASLKESLRKSGIQGAQQQR